MLEAATAHGRVALEDIAAAPTGNVAEIPTRNPAYLPVNQLEPQLFERLVAELIKSQNPSCHFYGRNGQLQHGLDIYEERSDGSIVLYQVKRYQEIDPAKLTEAVTDYAGPPRRPGSGGEERRFGANTFIVVTSAVLDEETANTDTIHALQVKYRGDLRLEFWGRETVSARLRNQPAIVEAYFSAAWAKEYCGRQYKKEVKRQEKIAHIRGVLQDAAGAQYDDGDRVHFKQVALSGTSVDSLFVDVPATATGDPETEHYIGELVGDVPRTGDQAVAVVGAAQLLLSQGWRRSAVVVGGPGQGKTTLLQYLTQFHRARVLGKDEYSPVAAGLTNVTDSFRFPLSVSLPDFARWRIEHTEVNDGGRGASTSARRPGPAATLEDYICALVERESGRDFGRQDLEVAIASLPLLLALDSLDEIGTPDLREDVSKEIIRAQTRLRAKALDTLILVATRPGHVGQPIWRSREFASVFLGRLTPALRMKYFERWADETNEPSGEVSSVRKKFVKAVELEHVAELAGNPMQLAILLHLLIRREMIPEQRTELYDAYMDLFMDREAKDLSIGNNKDALMAIFAEIAWRIQLAVEIGQSTGAISLDEIRRIVEGYEDARRGRSRVPNNLFESFTGRVLCLVERGLGSGAFEFDVQSLREYFVARHMFDRAAIAANPRARTEMFAAMLRRPYWHNVLRFFAGRMTYGEIPSVPHLLRDFQSDLKFGKHPLSRSVGKTLLDDGLFRDQMSSVVDDVWMAMLGGPGLILAADGQLSDDGSPFEVSDPESITDLLAYLRNRSVHSLGDLCATARVLSRIEDLGNAAGVWQDKAAHASTPEWLEATTYFGAYLSTEAGALKVLATIEEGPTRVSVARVPQALARMDFSLTSVEIIRQCVGQLAIGEAGAVVGGGPYAAVMRSAQPWTLSSASQLGAPGVMEVRAGERRRRNRRRSGRSSDPLTRLLTRANQATQLRDSGRTREYFLELEEIWGKGSWPVLLTAFSMPDGSASFDSFSSLGGDSIGWDRIAAWSHVARERSADAEWWSNELLAAGTAGAAQAAVALTALLVSAHSGTLRHVADQVQELCASLTRNQFSTLLDVVRSLHATDRKRRRADVAEGLRLGTFKPSGDYALLLWAVASDRTRSRLVTQVWSAGATRTEDPIVWEILRHSLFVEERRLPVSEFRSLRSGLPFGALSIEAIKSPTFAECDEILGEPERWPADVVRYVADHLATRLATLPAMSVEVERTAWFDPA